MFNSSYIVDASVLLDYFLNEDAMKSDVQKYKRSKAWLTEMLSGRKNLVYTNTVAMLELAKVLHYKKWEMQRIQIRIREMYAHYNFSIFDYDEDAFDRTMAQLQNLSQDREKCDIGELSLLPHAKARNLIFVSSDRIALKQFKHLKRINPRESDHIFEVNEEYED